MGRAVEVLVQRAGRPDSAPDAMPPPAALGKPAMPRAVKPLEAALSDEDSHVRVAAVEALSQIGHPQSASALLQLLQGSRSPSCAPPRLKRWAGWATPRIVDHIAATL